VGQVDLNSSPFYQDVFSRGFFERKETAIERTIAGPERKKPEKGKK